MTVGTPFDMFENRPKGCDFDRSKISGFENISQDRTRRFATHERVVTLCGFKISNQEISSHRTPNVELSGAL